VGRRSGTGRPTAAACCSTTSTPTWGENAEHPDWSPDGARLVFNDKTLSSAGSESISTIRPDGTGRHPLLQLPSNTDAFKPRYSPDGARIVFGCATSRDSDVCTMDADGSHVADITNTPFNLDGSGSEDAVAWGTAPG
jgi:Tol biopolymer transport system component